MRPFPMERNGWHASPKLCPRVILLEFQIQAEFHHPRAGRSASGLAEAQALNARGGRSRGNRSPGRVVKDIQALGLKGRVEALANGKRLVQRQVAPEPVRSVQKRMISQLSRRALRRDGAEVRLAVGGDIFRI